MTEAMSEPGQNAIEHYDDSSKVLLDAYNGGGHRLGAWSGLTLRFIRADGTETFRTYRALDVEPEHASTTEGKGLGAVGIGLKPCPCCGSEQVTTAPDREWGDTIWNVICKACGCRVCRDLERTDLIAELREAAQTFREWFLDGKGPSFNCALPAFLDEAIARLSTTPPPPVRGEDREMVARIINPVAFKSWAGLYDYGVRKGDPEEEARSTADWAYKADCEAALAKADAILALPALQPVGSRGEES